MFRQYEGSARRLDYRGAAIDTRQEGGNGALEEEGARRGEIVKDVARYFGTRDPRSGASTPADPHEGRGEGHCMGVVAGDAIAQREKITKIFGAVKSPNDE
jgi:hypothetical protein